MTGLSFLPMLSRNQIVVGLRMMLAGVVSHGGETPASFAFYSGLLRQAKTDQHRWR